MILRKYGQYLSGIVAGTALLGSMPQAAFSSTYNASDYLDANVGAGSAVSTSGPFGFGYITGATYTPPAGVTPGLLVTQTGNPLTLFPSHTDNALAINGFEAYTVPNQSDPNVLFNSNTSPADTISIAGFTIPAQGIEYGPYNSLGAGTGSATDIRFTVPTTGLYNIDATFDGNQNVNTDGEAFVLDNGVQLFNHVADGSAASTYNPSLVPLVAGDVLDFLVAGSTLNNTGTNNPAGFGNKSTLVSISISTPEPASLSLIGFSAVLLLGRRRRRAH